MYRIHNQLHRVRLERLRPTQMTVGLKEVQRKREHWATLGKKKRRLAMEEVFFPAVIGPKKQYYILDHHHSAVALAQEGAREVQVGVVMDLSALDVTEFWVYLDHESWAHPYDRRGRRRSLKEIPASLSALRDDPYRSLAGEVRDLGGFAKSDAPFLEFLWTNYFRDNIEGALVKSHYRKAIKQALRLAHSSKTQHLPGWVGKEK